LILLDNLFFSTNTPSDSVQDCKIIDKTLISVRVRSGHTEADLFGARERTLCPDVIFRCPSVRPHHDNVNGRGVVFFCLPFISRVTNRVGDTIMYSHGDSQIIHIPLKNVEKKMSRKNILCCSSKKNYIK
jgi:hypothetical protein